MYKTEMHCHSANVSTCAHATAEEIVEKYTAAGYTTIVNTEHINPWTFPRELEMRTWGEKVSYFIDGHKKLCAAAEGKLHILLGAEIRFFRENNSDYLVYGITEEFLRECGDVRALDINRLSAIVREHGLMIFQAHPFRPTMMVTDTRLLDGIEVGNFSPWHESNNEIAEAWAKKHNLLGITGTDFHNSDHEPAGGILTEYPIYDNETLIRTLRAGAYECIYPENFKPLV